MTTLEEKKKVIHGWFGDDSIKVRELLNGKTMFVRWLSPTTYKQWTPEKGGKDLEETLAKLDKTGLSHKLFWVTGVIANCFWFQNPANAETILNAVYEVIRESDGYDT